MIINEPFMFVTIHLLLSLQNSRQHPTVLLINCRLSNFSKLGNVNQAFTLLIKWIIVQLNQKTDWILLFVDFSYSSNFQVVKTRMTRSILKRKNWTMTRMVRLRRFICAASVRYHLKLCPSASLICLM